MFFSVLTSPRKDAFLQEVTLHLLKFSPFFKEVCLLHGPIQYVSNLDGI